MVATKNGSFPLPDFEERLWEELRQLHADGQQPSRRPRRSVYLGAVAVLTAAASLAAVLLVNRPTDERAETGQEPESTTGASSTVELIEVRELVRSDGARSIQWQDEPTGRYHFIQWDAAGNLDYESTWVAGPDPTTGVDTTLDHVNREYGDIEMGRATLTSNRQWLEQSIEDGTFVADGTQVIDGAELLRFVQHGQSLCRMGPEAQEACQEQGVPGDYVIWADPETRRPVREHIVDEYTGTYTYLPRTPENLALLDLTIPDDYRRVDSFSRPIGD